MENPVHQLQALVGNRAVQRLIQRSAKDVGGAFELDNDTAGLIDGQRGRGAALDSSVQAQMEQQTGHDLSGVQVHTDGHADALSRSLGAKAFTTGRDVFFREGAYAPQSSTGQDLLTHELTHVIQQSTGRVSGHSRMTVHAPGDAFEQEADRAAQGRTSVEAGIQRDVVVEDEALQKQEMPEEEELQTQEEEEELQMQEAPEEEEEVQAQEEEEEEEVQAEMVFDEEVATE
jgi:hypothetical protein